MTATATVTISSIKVKPRWGRSVVADWLYGDFFMCSTLREPGRLIPGMRARKKCDVVQASDG